MFGPLASFDLTSSQGLPEELGSVTHGPGFHFLKTVSPLAKVTFIVSALKLFKSALGGGGGREYGGKW